MQIFGAQMRVPADVLACAAAELLQPYDPAEPSACSRDSPAALIHMRLLDLVHPHCLAQCLPSQGRCKGASYGVNGCRLCIKPMAQHSLLPSLTGTLLDPM